MHVPDLRKNKDIKHRNIASTSNLPKMAFDKTIQIAEEPEKEEKDDSLKNGFRHANNMMRSFSIAAPAKMKAVGAGDEWVSDVVSYKSNTTILTNEMNESHSA